MEELLENFSVRTQLLIVAVGLIVLFFIVRLNTKRNRVKRNKNRQFGAKLKEHKKDNEK